MTETAPLPEDTPEAGEQPAQLPSGEGAPALRFEGRVALITGASNRGLGGAIARRLAAEGAKVVILSRTSPAKLLRRMERSGHDVLFAEGDVRHEEDIRRALDQTLQRFGQLDVLVNNAGIESFVRLAEMQDEQWSQVLDVNLTGAMRVSRACLPHLTEGSGAIVNIASALALGGCEGFTAYSATKAGLAGFTRSLAAELAPRGQRVVCVAPALVLSPMSLRYLCDTNEATFRSVEKSHPLGIGLPEDVAAAVAFLASSEAKWITGITLPLGWLPTYSLPTDSFMDPAENA